VELRTTQSGVYLLAAMALVCILQSADRNLFAVAIQGIKAEFRVTDTQLGAISGPAYAIILSLAGIPLARLAERVGRCRLIAGSVAAWSICTSATAGASGIFSLAASRITVGIGEAGAGPAVQSLLAARFSSRGRSGAMAVMYAGSYLGIFVGLALGGFLVEHVGWRRAFLCMGIPGLVLAPLVLLTVEEPPKAANLLGNTTIGDVVTILRTPGVLHFLAMFCLMGFATFGTTAWAPTFYSRQYGMDVERAGTVVGIVIGGGAVVGSLVGGLLTKCFRESDRDAEATFILWTLGVAIPAALGVFVVVDRALSVILLLFSTVVSCFPAGPIYALLHGLVEVRHRATAAAVTALAANLIGGLGPVFIGVLSDQIGGDRPKALRIALLAANSFYLWAFWHTYRVLATYRGRCGQLPASAST